MVFYHFYDDARKNSLSGHKKQILSLCLLLDCPRFSSVAPLSAFFFHGRSLPISFAHIYLFFQHLASPEGIRALSGATSPNARRLNRTVQTLNSAGAHRTSLIIVDFCQLSLSCHNWTSAPLSQLAARPVVPLVLAPLPPGS